MDFLLKKASIVTLGLAVAITPAVSVAAEENSENVEQQAVIDTASEQTTTEAVDVVVPDATTEGSTDSEAVADEPTSNEESEAPTEEVPAEEVPAEEAPAAEEPAATEDEVTEENTENTEEVEAETPNEEEVVTPPTEEGSTPNDEEVVDENEEDQPELSYEEIVAQMNGSVTGKVSEFDKEKGYYTLTINGSVTNNSEQAITNFYTGVDIPDDIMVLDTDETPQDIYLLEEETELAIPVGEVKAGETKNISISIPVIGKTSGANLLQDLNGYVIDAEGYLPVGSISGTSNLTFSTMTEATYFEGKAQAVTDFPGLADNQFGMQFGFKVQNLQIENIDNVKIEFIVPKGVTIHEPDSYEEGAIPDALDDFLDGGDLGLGSSRLDLDWNGNTASVNIGAIEAAGGYQGFFSAIGESNLSFEDIKKLQVKITLFSGNEAIESYTTPIELVKYQGNEEEPGDKPGNVPGDGTDNGSNTDPDKDNDGGTTPTPIVNKPTPNNSGKGNDPSENNSNNGGQVKGNNDSNIKVTPVSNNHSNNEQGGQLPKTAGTNPVGALMGGAIAALGAAILAVRKRLFQ